MKIAIFDAKSYDREFLSAANAAAKHDLVFVKPRLDAETAVLAEDFDGVCAFVNDCLDCLVLETLAKGGTKLVVLRCAGFNNVDLAAAKRLGIAVLRVPAYSPDGVAEHAVAMMLALNRKIPRAFNRVREGNFSLEGLLGFNLLGHTASVIGTGKIGTAVARILLGFGCRVLAYDKFPNAQLTNQGAQYVELKELLNESDIITLHCPLTRETHHIINAETLAQMKHGVMLINTSRGALLESGSVLKALKSGKIGYLGLDVYEGEGDLFFQDLSGSVLQDDVFARLTTFHNVLITAHQAFFTREAMENIAETTIGNITDFERGDLKPTNVVTSAMGE